MHAPAGNRRKIFASILSIATCVLTSSIGEAGAQEKVLNLYTARHYATDEAFYTGYTKATGIKINRIEGGEDALFERIKGGELAVEPGALG